MLYTNALKQLDMQDISIVLLLIENRSAKRVAGVVVAFLCKAINMAAPLPRLAMLPELPAVLLVRGVRVACF